MRPAPLTLQTYINEQWQDIAELVFNDDYQLASLSYLYDFEYLLQDNYYALSLNLPISLYPKSTKSGWLSFLDDIIPSGANRRYWINTLSLEHLPEAEKRYRLLQQGCIAPVGHLRIKQAVESLPTLQEVRLFELNEVLDRHSDFLDYANQQGAMAGGATGAGGEAPKLLLRRTPQNQIWIDNAQLGQVDDDYYLVKFPRGKRSSIDCDILRAEFHYYQELNALGFNTISVEKIRLEEGERYPSLWLPRFDIYFDETGNTQRYAMESVYSLLEKNSGSLLHHPTVIRELIAKINSSHLVECGFQFDQQTFVIEWVKRDLLNIAFGNSDNHGRNIAFLRDKSKIWLAPIYDFAPMKADPEGIPRSMSWHSLQTSQLELGGEYDFEQIAEHLQDCCNPTLLLSELKRLALHLVDLKTRLAERGVPASILNYPAIGFDYLPEKLQRWQLL